jgi:hypothetical protein
VPGVVFLSGGQTEEVIISGGLGDERGRLSTAELLVKMACFVKETNIFFTIRRS